MKPETKMEPFDFDWGDLDLAQPPFEDMRVLGVDLDNLMTSEESYFPSPLPPVKTEPSELSDPTPFVQAAAHMACHDYTNKVSYTNFVSDVHRPPIEKCFKAKLVRSRPLKMELEDKDYLAHGTGIPR